MTSSLEQKRKKYKKWFNTLLQKYAASSDFQKQLYTLIGPGAKIVQYSSKYKHQCLQILAYQFSSIGNTNHAKVLMLSAAGHHDVLSHELDHLDKTGLSSVILDKNDNVCWFQSVWDHCDMPPKDYEIKNTKYRRKYEICEAAFKNDPLYQKMIASRENDIQFGEVLYNDKSAIRPDLNGKGLLYISPDGKCWTDMGYKYSYSLPTNPKTIKWGKDMSKSKMYGPSKVRINVFDFSNFVFSDGSSIDQYYNALKQETDLDVERIKRKYSHIGCMVCAFPAYTLDTFAKM